MSSVEIPAEVRTIAIAAAALLAVVVVALSVFVARAILFPPFSSPRSGEQLSKASVAAAWAGKHTNPLHDFGIAFEDVEFESVCGHTLRGWFIDRRAGTDGSGPGSAAVAGGSAASAPGPSEGLRRRRDGGGNGGGGGSGMGVCAVPAAADGAGAGAGPAAVSRRSKDDILIIFVHGGGRDRRAFLRHTPLVCEEGGYSALLFDFRAHGASDLDHLGLSMGIREHEDVMAAVRFGRERLGFRTTVLIGTSVGAYSSILATAKLPVPAVAGVVAENPFTNIQANVRGIVLNLLCRRVVCRNRDCGVRLVYPLRILIEHLVWCLVARSLGKEAHLSTNDALAIIDRIPQPLLFMHGDRDHLIHHKHAVALHAAASEPKELWIAPGADHTALINAHPDEFGRRVLGFLEARRREFVAGADTAPEARGGGCADGAPRAR